MAHKVMVFLETADGAYCVLTGADGRLAPSAEGAAAAGEALPAAAARLLQKNMGLEVPPSALRAHGTFECGGEDYALFSAHYTMSMGPLTLAPEFAGDEWLDRQELHGLAESDPGRLSPLLLTALHYF